jgi:uncharacterized membrane protein
MLEEMFHLLGFGLCHQLPARSLLAGGYQLPVCARDTGMYIGFVASLALIAVLERGRHRTEFPYPWLLALGGLLFAIMAFDGVTSYAGLRTTTNLIRFATGMCAGWALPLVVVPMVNTSLWSDAAWGRVLSDRWAPLAWVVGLPVVTVVGWMAFPMLGVAYPIALSVAILATFTTVNLIIVSMFPAFERKFLKLRQAWLPLAISLALGVAEVALAAGLRVFLQSLAGIL